MIIPHSKPSIDKDDIKAVTDVLSSGQIAQGDKVREFEDRVAKFVGVKHAVACSSGTSALHLALYGLGVKRGDEVIIPSYVCSSPYFATLYTGATPIIVDIDITDFNICAETVREHVSLKTKAIIVPHMFGNPAELNELLMFDIPIIEDCAQSLGAEYKGQQVGSFGDLSIASFYATKMMTTGEGGMVLTNNSKLYLKIIEARDYDRKPLTPIKYNYKMTDFQASLGVSQLKKLPYFIKRRREISSVYNNNFSEYNNVRIPQTCSRKNPVFYRYIIMVDDVDHIQKRAKENSIMCEKPVHKPLHKSFTTFNCPNSDRVYERVLSIPLYPSLTEREINYLLQRFKDILSKL